MNNQIYRMAKNTVGFIYLANARGTNRYKIGYTTRTIEQRIKEINSKQSPFPIVLIKYVTVQNVKAAERKLHQQYAHYKKYNEWFELNYSQLENVCDCTYRVTREL